MTTEDLARVPDECTLPTAERPVRLAEFDDLFATSVLRVEPVNETHVRLHLSGGPGLEATVRDLTARETECCTFRFTVSARPTATVSARPAGLDEVVMLDIEVPARHADVLRALAGRATAAAAGRG